jgi:MYXO-CTERM domain-containing protein
MRPKNASFVGFLLAAGAFALAPAAAAHPVTVDGAGTEWLVRVPNADNLGLIARNAQGQGEYVWRDALADTRTDLATPEVVADIAAFQVTGDATGVGFLLRRAPGVGLVGAPIQVQIAIDTDRVDGSGQEFLAEFADTKVANVARWERLVETLFGSGGTAKVIDANFNQIAVVSAMQGATGDVEIFVPWTALGLNAPPTTPLRFTVATFRAQNNDLTVDIGGAMFSNALDVVSDYGDPAASMYPNTYQDVQDQIVNYAFDLSFDGAGEVYAPLVVQRFLSKSSGGGPDEWVTVKNVSPSPLALAGFKIGDEETPDGNEGMFSFPAAATLAAGASFTVARSGSAYQTFFGVAPDAEIPPGASMAVPDMASVPTWTSAAMSSFQLADNGDEILVLDPSNTILDIAVFGNGVYAGVTPFAAAPGTDEALTRNALSADTDNCQVDFANAGKTCTMDSQCGGVCAQCAGNVCGSKPQGAACPNANPCDGDEICNGSGACVPSAAPPCDDSNACTADTCTPAMGCIHTSLAAGASCSDADVCNGTETCNAAGMCVASGALDCADNDPCTVDACDAVTGCSNAPAPAGSSCADADACNGTETCDAAGMCVPGMALDCDDNNPCTADTCDALGGCKHTDAADGTACGDGDACNGDELCAAGQCAPGAALDCDDQNLCTADACDAATGCTHDNEPQGTACDDNDACTMPDVCDGQGQCTPGDGGCGGSGGAGGSGGDGGSGGTTTTTTTTTGAGGDGGQGGDTTIDPGGCGCRAAGGDDRTSSLAWLGTLALAAGFARRRRRV